MHLPDEVHMPRHVGGWSSSSRFEPILSYATSGRRIQDCTGLRLSLLLFGTRLTCVSRGRGHQLLREMETKEIGRWTARLITPHTGGRLWLRGRQHVPAHWHLILTMRHSSAQTPIDRQSAMHLAGRRNSSDYNVVDVGDLAVRPLPR